jgi:AcrR family transcriptional regulator
MFSTVGYDATSVTDILEAAGVSRGAIYHHFRSKEDVFAAVFLQVSTAAIRDAARRIPKAATPFEALVAGCLGWLDAVENDEVRRILIVDGPRALGWERARTLEEGASLGVVRTAIANAVASNELTVASVDVAARLINAMLSEAAVHRPTQSPPERRRAGAVITAMLNGLRSDS